MHLIISHTLSYAIYDAYDFNYTVQFPTLRKKTVTEPNIIFVFFTIFTTFRVFFKIQEMYYRYEIAGPFHNPCLLQYAYGLTLPSVSFSGINFKIG